MKKRKPKHSERGGGMSRESLLEPTEPSDSLEDVIEELRCKGCWGYPETKLKVLSQAIRNWMRGRVDKLWKDKIGYIKIEEVKEYLGIEEAG